MNQIDTRPGAELQEAIVGGIPVQAFQSAQQLAAIVIDDHGKVAPGSGIAINPEKIMRARKSAKLTTTLLAATLRFADGAGVVWALRRKGLHCNRVTGVDIWEQLMQRAASRQVPVFLLGARPEVLQQTTERLRDAFPGITVAAALHGYAGESEIEKFIESLEKAGPAVVSIAMGSPKQENLIARMRETCPSAFFIGVGGTFDCFVGNVKRAPAAWQRANLEWLYRLIGQPSRIRRQWVLLPYACLVLANRL